VPGDAGQGHERGRFLAGTRREVVGVDVCLPIRPDIVMVEAIHVDESRRHRERRGPTPGIGAWA
jgi:hypothetical protein